MWYLKTCVLMAVSVCPAGMHAQRSATVAEQYLFSAANAERGKRGLPLLQWDAQLYQAAGGHAAQMAARRSISHQYGGEPELSERVQATGSQFSVVAENVAEAPNAVQIHDAWMASPGHRANLLDARLNAVGIRVLARGGELYAVQDFARVMEKRTLEDQEQAVVQLIERDGAMAATPGSDAARQTCAVDHGFAGPRHPGFVVRFTDTELARLPDPLLAQLASGKFSRAEVGACNDVRSGNFTSFRLAVLLFR